MQDNGERLSYATDRGAGVISPNDCFTNLAAALTCDLLKAGLSRLQTLVQGSPEEQALRRALLAGQVLQVTGARRIAVRADLHGTPWVHRWPGTPVEGGAVRMSAGWFNRAEEIEVLLENVKSIAV